MLDAVIKNGQVDDQITSYKMRWHVLESTQNIIKMPHACIS